MSERSAIRGQEPQLEFAAFGRAGAGSVVVGAPEARPRLQGLGCRLRRALRRFACRQFHPQLHRSWLAYLELQGGGVVSHHLRAHLAAKPSNPYLRRWLSYPERVAVLVSHYDLVAARLDPGSQAALASGRPVHLATLVGRGGRRYVVELRGELSKEGELSFALRDDDGTPLADLRGTFAGGPDGGVEFLVGGLQGPKPPLGRRLVVQATRDLHGLRPKNAVLHAAAAFAEAFGACRLVAPPRGNHVSHRWYRHLARRRLLHSDLAQFWGEFTDRRDPRGDFIMPLPLPRRAADEVAGRKRREWLARYASIDEIGRGVAAMVEGRTDAATDASGGPAAEAATAPP